MARITLCLSELISIFFLFKSNNFHLAQTMNRFGVVKSPSARLVWCFCLYEGNSSIKQLFKLPVGSSIGCKIYEQQYKQTVDGSKRVPKAAGRESLAITTQSITHSTRHIQPQAPQQCIQNIFPHSHVRRFAVISYCVSSCFYYIGGRGDTQPCNLHIISLYLKVLKCRFLHYFIFIQSINFINAVRFTFLKLII